MDAITILRNMERGKAYVDRGGVLAKCQHCGVNSPTDYHEILSRGRTVKNASARALSFDRRICSFLCNACHIQGSVHNAVTATALLRKNIEVYGRDAVYEAWKLATEAMGTRIDIEFPENQEETNETRNGDRMSERRDSGT